MRTPTGALLTEQGVHLQDYNGIIESLSYWIQRPLDWRMTEADRILASLGWKRTTEWVYTPIKSDGLTASIVQIEEERTK